MGENGGMDMKIKHRVECSMGKLEEVQSGVV